MQLTARELNEIKLALYYEKHCAHGTAGHNQYMLIAKMAKQLGMKLGVGADGVNVWDAYGEAVRPVDVQTQNDNRCPYCGLELNGGHAANCPVRSMD